MAKHPKSRKNPRPGRHGFDVGAFQTHASPPSQ
jgi:hypothetical protein